MNTQNLNIDLKSAEDILCEACGNNTFKDIAFFKRVSALLSPTGKEGIVPLATIACTKCGHINDEFNPLKKLNDS